MSTEANRSRPRSTASIFGHPIHPMLVPFPIAFFVGAWVTDIIYSRTTNLMWQYFSIWMITAGLIMGGLAAVVGFVDYFGDRRIRKAQTAKIHMVLNIVVFVLEFINAFVHSRDGWTAVVPDGIIISSVAVALLAVSAWFGGSLSYRHGVGVSDIDFRETGR